MLTLDVPTGPRWLDLPEGVRVRIRPVTTAVIEAARAAADRGMAEARQAEGEIALDREVGLRMALLIEGLAQHAIIDWEGVADAAGQALPVSPAAITQMMTQHYHIAAAFWVQATAPASEVAAEGNGCAPAPPGDGAAVPPTAGVANALG